MDEAQITATCLFKNNVLPESWTEADRHSSDTYSCTYDGDWPIMRTNVEADEDSEATEYRLHCEYAK
ncbi:MAG: hypothetical protein IJV22_04485 [Bacteroidales bacterium]|nr:hypothetical protein [Bacteroidales bacterium]